MTQCLTVHGAKHLSQSWWASGFAERVRQCVYDGEQPRWASSDTEALHSTVIITSACAAGAWHGFRQGMPARQQPLAPLSEATHVQGGNIQLGPGWGRTDCCRTLSRGSVASSRGWATGCRPGPATLASCSVQAQAWQATAGLLALSPATTAATMGPPWLRITCTVLVVSEAVVTMGVTAACTVCKPAGWPCQ